ncbi:GDP-mannose 4,6-dehydratase [Mycolicibacterium aichiense]|uniref:GDP-mannose 4,6-dehydratase n=1 Tax=Mycolicibacterium aichiense TaxID=1799 RepID=A0AAD1MD42_9MYCO|nr:GDP-mannose 4,6-dehydratase [Mycolicibacterium aichiense]MCV7019267.1 GDP-mannose 4,6-dehydratase [Mycolicibacterium aichiense]BBX09183.1 hypothetical protein MAIC_39860 [Mycolicibacterium aichiense]SUA13754.1 GmdA [Mycolicibacterium aichiense]
MVVHAKTALITGITGQDGGHLAPLLHEKGYEVFGVIRGQSNLKKEQLLDEFPYVNLIEADLLDPSSIIRAVDQSDPDEFYNFGAVSQATVCNRFARSGWEALQPVCTALGKPLPPVEINQRRAIDLSVISGSAERPICEIGWHAGLSSALPSMMSSKG